MTELKHVLSPEANSTKLPSSGHFGTSQADSLPTDRLTVANGYDYFKKQIHLKLGGLLTFEEGLKLSEDKRRSEIRSVLQRLIAAEEGRLAGSNDQERLIQDLLSD